MEEMEIEKLKLEEVLKDYHEYIDDTTLEMDNVFKLHTNKEEAIEIKNRLEQKLKILKQNVTKPYFARIDFQNNKENGSIVLNVGVIFKFC